MSGMLAGRNAIVTGSSNGIGRACAIELARAGARVLVNYHGDANGAAAVVEEIERNGGRAIPFKADVGVEAEVKAMFDGGADPFALPGLHFTRETAAWLKWDRDQQRPYVELELATGASVGEPGYEVEQVYLLHVLERVVRQVEGQVA